MLADAARRAREVEIERLFRPERCAARDQAAAAAVVLLVVALRRARPRQTGGRRRLADAVRARHARGDAGQRADQGRLAAGDPGASGRQSRAGHRAGAGRGWRRVARDRDDDRQGRVLSTGDGPGRRIVQVPRGRRRRHLADLRDHASAHPPRVPRIDVDYTYSGRTPARAADRDRQRRHLRAGRHRRPGPRDHRSARGQRAADADRRQADCAGRRRHRPN